jgi:hypothetical protein
MAEKKESLPERAPERKRDLQAQLDELGKDPRQVGDDSAGQSGDTQGLSDVEEASEESVEELASANQDLEAASVEGSEDAADHPTRPTHTHEEYGYSEELPKRRKGNKAA